MAISVYPVPVTSSLNASAITAASANTLYEGRATFDPAIYTITCASGVITNFTFLSGDLTEILSGVTVSGTVAVSTASTADRIRLWTDSGTNTVVTITKTASALTNQFSGTLDTITSSTTYTTTGTAYAVCVGGGGGGCGANVNGGGGGGGSGAITSKLVTLTGSMAIVVGAAGGAQANGGTTTFAGMSAGGGTGSTAYTRPSPGGAGGTATGGTFNIAGAAGTAGHIQTGGAKNGVATGTAVYTFVKAGTTGSGGGSGNSSSSPGGGSGIGTGGTGAGYNQNGGSATGYGGGGGGACTVSGNPGSGGAGSPGVVYILRF